VIKGHPVWYFTQASPVFFGRGWPQIAAPLLLPAATAALVYALPAAAARDDLGGYPAADSEQPSTAVERVAGCLGLIADGGAPSCR
jgi:hypothetical protein